jgi:hypothetical protein|tara:strand:- start:47 stop:922 length:876 start_codon:yes stop_codon:yes gene_type:complete
MSIFKRIKNENLTTNSSKLFKTTTVNTSSLGVSNYKFNSESSSLSAEGSYYNSIKMNFYLSGSDYSVTESRFNNPWFRKQSHFSSTFQEHLNKFHTYKEGHFYNIPQNYYGQRIERGTFELTDKSTPYNLLIKDDGYGNLYSTNAFVTSSESNVSSSENYIGNIFYDYGIAVITTPEYFSGSNDGKYSNLGTNYSMTFNSEKDIFTSTYKLRLNQNEFQATNNPSAAFTQSLHNANLGYLSNNLTSSNWAPYFNTIGFYDDYENLVMTARYPQNIKRRKDIPITLVVNMDW